MQNSQVTLKTMITMNNSQGFLHAGRAGLTIYLIRHSPWVGSGVVGGALEPLEERERDQNMPGDRFHCLSGRA